jgi:metal-responsive CopG/Arc/MetJ family transcriptional regulator
MTEKSRKQMLEEIVKRFCQLRLLNYELINDLLSQLQNITTKKGDEERSLLVIVQIAKKELKKYKKESSQTAKNNGLRIVLFNVINDLTIHIRIYFSDTVPPNSFLMD